MRERLIVGWVAGAAARARRLSAGQHYANKTSEALGTANTALV